MNAARSILDAFTIFPFAIVLALALGEAFKTVVVEEDFIHWNRLFSLASFLLLILPFYQGMNRYLLVTYGVGTTLPTNYAPYLIIDGAAFMLESALFFVLSRTLRLEEWARFYWVVFILLAVDSAWGLTVRTHAPVEGAVIIQGWTTLNLVTGIFILLLLLIGPRLPYVLYSPSAIGTSAMFVRTVMDYWISWSFYFPPPH